MMINIPLTTTFKILYYHGLLGALTTWLVDLRLCNQHLTIFAFILDLTTQIICHKELKKAYLLRHLKQFSFQQY